MGGSLESTQRVVPHFLHRTVDSWRLCFTFQQYTHRPLVPLMGKCSLKLRGALPDCSVLLRFAGGVDFRRATSRIGAGRAYRCRELYVPMRLWTKRTRKILKPCRIPSVALGTEFFHRMKALTVQQSSKNQKIYLQTDMNDGE